VSNEVLVRLVVGDLGGIREDDESSEPRNWGDHGNLDLHGWAFDRFTTLLDYKAEAEGYRRGVGFGTRYVEVVFGVRSHGRQSAR
jgi:hypothetical protein